MRRYEEIADEVKIKHIFKINEAEKELEKLEKEVTEARLVYEAKLGEHKVAKLKLNDMKKASELVVHEVFEKELKAEYLPEATVKMADMVYIQASEHTSTMDEIAANYEELVEFYNSLKEEDSSK